MIVFDRNSKSLDIPVGLGNLEVNIVTPASPADIVESAVTEANQYTDEQVESALTEAKGYTDTQIEGLDIPNTYVLNLMTQEECVALYNELQEYVDEAGKVSSTFPIEKYRFYFFSNDGSDNGGGFIPMRFSNGGTSLIFEGIRNGYVGRNFKNVTFQIYEAGNTATRINDCSVFSLNGQKGALNLKTINGNDILGTGDITIQTGVSSDSVTTIWRGTQAQYDAITTKDPNTLYFVSD